MTIDKKTPVPEPDQNAVIALAAAAASPGSMSPELAELLTLMLKRQAKISKVEEENEASAKRAQEQNARTLELERLRKQEEQEACTHRNEHNQSMLTGQRTQQGFAVLVCQRCQKPFSIPAQRPEEQVPPGLEPRGGMLGGPHIV